MGIEFGSLREDAFRKLLQGGREAGQSAVEAFPLQNWVWALLEWPLKEKAMMGLTHPNVVKLLAEVRKDDGVIMELCT